jgi:predicted RecB family nuclease
MTQMLSASRLNDFLGCRHRANLWLSGVKPPEEVNASLDLVRAKGFEHEAQVLAALEREHGPAVRIPDGKGIALETRLQATQTAIKAGAPLIYQAAFVQSQWVGYPDFLVRSGQNASGDWRYVPEDAKLARRAKAEHVIQLNVYANLIEQTTGVAADEGTIHVGGSQRPERFDLRKTRHITNRLVRQFEEFAQETERKTEPVKTSACDQCAYRPRCEAEWRAADSTVFVAGIRGDQIIKLKRGGVDTLSDLAAADPSVAIEGVGSDTLRKLIRQAKLQKATADTGRLTVEALPVEPGRGFALLPSPQKGDLFFDMEGDPLYPEGLEYLFGVLGPFGPGGEEEFKDFWAHSHEEEKVAFEAFMECIAAHLGRYPAARIYHYAPYETTALKRLASRYATMEALLDQMLREHRFVDLYKVARQGLQASTEGYSLKDLEKIYWGGRSGDVTNAGDSIVEYERWRETKDQPILDAILRYNEDDVRSTARMRNWLESLRPKDGAFGIAAVEEEPDEKAQARAEAREVFERRRRELAEGIRNSDIGDERIRDLLAELLWFHQRAQKPVWWEIFERQTWTDDELVEDVDSLGSLTIQSQTTDKQSYVATYTFPPQDTRLKAGSKPKFSLSLDNAGTIFGLNVEEGRIVLRRSTRKGNFPEFGSLVPGKPIDQGKLIDGLVRVLEALCEDSHSQPALIDFLARRSPRLSGRASGAPVTVADADLVQETVAAVLALDSSTLIIQGPPGTGKTYTTARAIVALLKDGKRVGVSSNSHKAIDNVLQAVQEHADDIRFTFVGAKKATAGDEDTMFVSACITPVESSGDIGQAYRLVGGTAYHFAGETETAFDYLFVDEAGQVALGNLVAMAGCAANIVLVGDQMQLPQPVQGIHPGETGLSCLDYAMQEHATVPPERGVLLNVSRRMHPTICEFISDAIYDGRLTSHASTETRRLVVKPGAHTAIRPVGLSLVEVAHEGCTQNSPEEGDVIKALVAELLDQSIADGEKTRKLKLSDIVVVTPFNMQVALLKRLLPEGARVGTVDKFQGQEAPVVIVSMATSFGGDAPRGTAFLFNRNRLNVAFSRAQCLAILVRGRSLLEVPQPDKEDLARLDLLARYEALSSTDAAAEDGEKH